MIPVLQTVIQQATLAPSGHNTQPWLFSATEDTIRIHPDFSRRLPVVDPDDHALYISLGCALENMTIAAAHHGLAATVECFPAGEPEPCLKVRLAPLAGNGRVDDADGLYRAIPLRQTNRRRYADRAIPSDQVAVLAKAGVGDGVTVLAFQRHDPDMDPLIELVEEANRRQFDDRAFVDELVSWIRFSKSEVRAHRDGLTARALGFPAIPRRLGTLIMTRLVTPEGEAKRQADAVRNAPLSLLFIAHRNDPAGWVELGRSFERTALTATALDIAHAHVNMPCEVLSVRRKLARWLQLDAQQQPLLLVRFGYAKRLPQAPRRPLEQVMRRA